MDKIKTFPLQFTESKLKEIKEAAKEQRVSAKDFMLTAIEKALKKVKK